MLVLSAILSSPAHSPPHLSPIRPHPHTPIHLTHLPDPKTTRIGAEKASKRTRFGVGKASKRSRKGGALGALFFPISCSPPLPTSRHASTCHPTPKNRPPNNSFSRFGPRFKFRACSPWRVFKFHVSD